MEHQPASESAFTGEHANPSGHGWVLTLADLLSLLTAFFIMLFSFSSLESNRWRETTSALTQRTPPAAKTDIVTPASKQSVQATNPEASAALTYLYNIIRTHFRENPLLNQHFFVHILGGRLVISYIGDESFHKASAALTPQAAEAITALAMVIQTMPNQIEVYGNASPEPINTKRYPSNWELSIARAATVAETLEAAGYIFPIRIYGRAESGFDALSISAGDERRFSASRRVDVVLLPEKVAL